MENTKIKIGDIFAGDEGRPCYYEVVQKRGRKTVALRRLVLKSAGYSDTEFRTILVTPEPGKYRGDTITRRILVGRGGGNGKIE